MKGELNNRIESIVKRLYEVMVEDPMEEVTRKNTIKKRELLIAMQTDLLERNIDKYISYLDTVVEENLYQLNDLSQRSDALRGDINSLKILANIENSKNNSGDLQSRIESEAYNLADDLYQYINFHEYDNFKKERTHEEVEELFIKVHNDLLKGDTAEYVQYMYEAFKHKIGNKSTPFNFLDKIYELNALHFQARNNVDQDRNSLDTITLAIELEYFLNQSDEWKLDRKNSSHDLIINFIRNDIENGNTDVYKNYMFKCNLNEELKRTRKILYEKILDYEIDNYPHYIAYEFKDYYLTIQNCDEGYDYTLYDKEFNHLDGGVIEDDYHYPYNIYEAKNVITELHEITNTNAIIVDYDEIQESIDKVDRSKRVEAIEYRTIAPKFLTLLDTFEDRKLPLYANIEGKRFVFGYGKAGNGTTVWNYLEESNNDYVNIANVSDSGELKIWVTDLPQTAIDNLEMQANRIAKEYRRKNFNPLAKGSNNELPNFNTEEYSLSVRFREIMYKKSESKIDSIENVCKALKDGKGMNIKYALYCEMKGGNEESKKESSELLYAIKRFEDKNYPSEIAFRVDDEIYLVKKSADEFKYSIYDTNYNFIQNGMDKDLLFDIYSATCCILDLHGVSDLESYRNNLLDVKQVEKKIYMNKESIDKKVKKVSLTEALNIRKKSSSIKSKNRNFNEER